MIAKQGNTIYVAFRSEVRIAEMKRKGYDDVLSSQASQIPVRFFTELFWSHYRVVLTGFSFGGLLACCVMANLWQDSRISAEVLLKQTTCIIFGAPFIKIQLIDQVLKMFPDLKKSIHSVFLKDDLFPQIMGYVSLAEPKEKKIPLQGNEESRQGATSMLARAKRVRVMTESLINLQEDCLQMSKKYSQAVSPALRPNRSIMRDLKNLKDEINSAPESTPEDTMCLVYGACYVIAVDSENQSGVVWQQPMSTTPKILALHLTFQRNALVKKITAIQQQLFKKVLGHYNIGA
jgi:hypothetical protein